MARAKNPQRFCVDAAKHTGAPHLCTSPPPPFLPSPPTPTLPHTPTRPTHSIPLASLTSPTSPVSRARPNPSRPRVVLVHQPTSPPSDRRSHPSPPPSQLPSSHSTPIHPTNSSCPGFAALASLSAASTRLCFCSPPAPPLSPAHTPPLSLALRPPGTPPTRCLPLLHPKCTTQTAPSARSTPYSPLTSPTGRFSRLDLDPFGSFFGTNGAPSAPLGGLGGSLRRYGVWCRCVGGVVGVVTVTCAKRGVGGEVRGERGVTGQSRAKAALLRFSHATQLWSASAGVPTTPSAPRNPAEVMWLVRAAALCPNPWFKAQLIRPAAWQP